MKQAEQQRIDAAVMNSVINLPKTIPFLERHPTIHTFFDNDDAGRKAVAELKRLCPNSTVADQPFFYRNHKDLNEYWQAKRYRQQPRPSIISKRKTGMKM